MTALVMATLPTDVPLFDGATPLPAHPLRAFVEHVMGLPVSVHVRGPLASADAVRAAVTGFFDALREDDALFSPWKPDSEVSRIQRGDLRMDDAGERVRTVARLCGEAAERTGGAFSAWLPGPDGRPRFDPTGLVKGWAVDQALQTLAADPALRDHDLMVNAGGDVAVRCTRTDTPAWRIAVEDPRDRRLRLAVVPLRTGAVATSGTAARGAHILDPATGCPVRAHLLSATVIGPSLTWADVYATAAFVLGERAGDWLTTLPDHAGLLVDADKINWRFGSGSGTRTSG